jgi:hypothetical protein
MLQARLLTLDKLDEKRRIALLHNEIMHDKRKIKHDKQKKKAVKFDIGDLVLLLDCWLVKQKGQKFYPKWKGPYEIYATYNNDTYMLCEINGNIINKRYNIEKLKLFRART